MQKFNHIIKWYSYGIFKWPLFEILIGFILILEYFALSYYKSTLNPFVDLMQLLIIPIYVFLIHTVFFTNSKVLIFELSIFKNYRKLAIGKITAAYLGFIPFIIGTLIILEYFNKLNLFMPVLLSLIIYSSFMFIISLSAKSVVNYISSMILLFLLPTGVISLVSTHMQMGMKIKGVYGYTSYLFAPLYSAHYYSIGEITLNPTNGLLFAFLTSLILYIIYIYFSGKTEIIVSSS